MRQSLKHRYVYVTHLTLIPNHRPTPSLPVGLKRGADVHANVKTSSSTSSGRRVLDACKGMSGVREERIDVYLRRDDVSIAIS
jgi:hypothetical protein